LAGLPAAFGLRPAVFGSRVVGRNFGDRREGFWGVIGFNATPEFEAGWQNGRETGRPE
jgi:hypothetical protein